MKRAALGGARDNASPGNFPFDMPRKPNRKLEIAKSVCRYVAKYQVLANPTITSGGKGVGFVVAFHNGDTVNYRVAQSIFDNPVELEEFAIVIATRALGVRA